MKDIGTINNPWGDAKVSDACAIFGMMDTSGKPFSGTGVIQAIANMHARSNGLGGGLAIYGLYPEYLDAYAFHIMYLSLESRREVEAFLGTKFNVLYAEEVPTRPGSAIAHPPLVWRYFLELKQQRDNGASEEDNIVSSVMQINTGIADAFVFSSGKNMGVFKGVGYPEEIAEYFRLDEYKGYLWTAHGRFPTNTPGWWGGAHPFSILDWTVVHNGEISSYGINRRCLEQYGYRCALQTDTEVIAYAVDLLARRHGLPINVIAQVLSAPLWTDIARSPPEEQRKLTALRQTYGGLLLNGPFTVIIARQGEMVGLTDRLKLRPLVAGTKGSVLYLSSEESSIRLVCPDLEKAWTARAGEPVIGSLQKPLAVREPVLKGIS